MATMPPMPMPPPPPAGMPPMPPTEMNAGMPAMHMAFFWGHRVQVLFSNWPGDRRGAGMYVLCLLILALLAALVEVLAAAAAASASHGHGLSRRSRGALPLLLLVTGIHAVKTGLSYLVMLAVMSFNAGVFLAVLAGHSVGFMLARRGMPGRRATADDVPANGALPPSEPKP